jgi:hypothetical protein
MFCIILCFICGFMANSKKSKNIQKKYQSGVFYMVVKLYNSLPSYIKRESNSVIKFEPLLKKFLLGNTFYSLDEFYNFI